MISLAGLPLPDVLAELPLLLVDHVPRALQLVAVIIVVAAISAASPPAVSGLSVAPISVFLHAVCVLIVAFILFQFKIN